MILPLASASPQNLSIPRRFGSLRHHFNAKVAASFTKDGSNLVSQWGNQVGSYNVSATGSARPTYLADAGDGLPGVLFSAGNYLQNTASFVTAEDSFAMVVEIGIFVSATTIIGGHTTNRVSTTDTLTNWSPNGSTDGTQALRNAKPLLRGKKIILTGRRSANYQMFYGGSGTRGLIEIRENGATVKKTTHTGGTTAGGLYLSNTNNDTTLLIREWLNFDSCLTDTQMLAVESYLRDAWNVDIPYDLTSTLHPGVKRWMVANGQPSPSARYPLVVSAGQSNNGGRAYTDALPTILSDPIAGAIAWYGGSWGTLQLGINNYPSIAGRHGTELTLAYDMAQTFGNVAYIKAFEDGTSALDRWLPSLPNASNLTVAAINNVWNARNDIGLSSGIQLDPALLGWIQGEADTGDANHWGTYQANENAILSAFRSKIDGGQEFKIASVKVNSAAYGEGYQNVNAAKTANSLSMENYFLVERSLEGLIDGVHANSASLMRQGDDMAAIGGATVRVT